MPIFDKKKSFRPENVEAVIKDKQFVCFFFLLVVSRVAISIIRIEQLESWKLNRVKSW